MVSEFSEFFPNDFSSMSPYRDLDFFIYFDLGMRPISIPPYRMAPTELRENKAQIQELIDKIFIRPSTSYVLLRFYLLIRMVAQRCA